MPIDECPSTYWKGYPSSIGLFLNFVKILNLKLFFLSLIKNNLLEGDENVLETDIMVAQHCKCTKCQGVANFEIIDFVLHEFHFN